MAVTKMPQASPQCDQLGSSALVDPEPASVALLHHIDNTLHALSTIWGWPTLVQRFHMPTNGTTKSVMVQGPPSVQWFNVGLLVSGQGSATITGPASDGSGYDTTTLYWTFASAPNVIGGAQWIWTTGQMDHSVAATNSPAILAMIDGHVGWSVNETLLFAVNPADSGGLTAGGALHAIAFSPIWEPRAL